MPALLCLAALAAGCGEYGGTTPVSGNLRGFLQTTPDECGLEETAGVDPVELEQAGTVDAQVARLVPLVERVRGLRRRRPLRTSIVSADVLERELRRDAAREYRPEEAALDRRALVLLGAIRPELELRRTLVGAAADGVLGFYDTERRRMVVVREGAGRLDDFELEVLGHEIVHALVDARLDPPAGRDEDDWGDTHTAAAALEEGDASVVELRLVGVLEGGRALRELLYSTPAEDAFARPDLPHFLAASFVFPYLEGIGFVCRLYERGGWGAVDAAYRRPPTTTAEILFPDRYLARERALPLPRTGRLPPPWKRPRNAGGAFGAADLLWLFEAPGDRRAAALSRPLERAAAWGGGRIELWTRGPDSAVVLALAQRGGDAGLCESMTSWYAAAFQDARRSGTVSETAFSTPKQAAVVACTGQGVVVAIGPDRATVRRLSRPPPTG